MTAEKTIQPICHLVKQTIENYFIQLEGQPAVDLHSMVIREVEKPLLEAVLEHTKSNQSSAAKILGLSRGTLRKKIIDYDLEH